MVLTRTVKYKLTQTWNSLLRHLMISDDRASEQVASSQPSYEALSSTLSAIPDLMFELDSEGRHWDAHVLRPELLVAPAEQLLGHTVTNVMPQAAAKLVMQGLEVTQQSGYAHGIHIHLPTAIGPRWFEVSIARKQVSPCEQQDLRFIVLSRDITERKLAHLEAEKLAYIDQLTELPNRHAVQHELLARVASQHLQGFYSALLFLDLDDFKNINDNHGHHVGDLLLKQVAQRLRDNVREDDMLIRWGGDEFIVLLNKLSDDHQQAQQFATTICRKIADKVSEPYFLEHIEYRCHISIGVSLFNDPQCCIDTIIQQADSAMYKAKKSHSERYAFYQQAGVVTDE